MHAEPTDDHTLRLSLTLPGSASLGAYQAGATAALATMVTSLRDRRTDVRVDAIGGASAGSIVAMLLAHCLLNGRDTPRMLRAAWVDEVDVDLLRGGGAAAPLAFDDLHERVREFLADADEHPFDVHARLADPLTLQVSLTTLLGFAIPTRIGDDDSDTLTFSDWLEFELRPGGGPDDVLDGDPPSVLDAVLASAAHPGAFAPRCVDRSDHHEHFRARGIDRLPDDRRLWYTDGGLVESEPVGRIVRAARRRAGGAAADRLHLVIDPRSSGPSGSGDWASGEGDRSWMSGVRRALSVLPTQALHDDLRRVAELNERFDRLDDALERLAPIVDDTRMSRDELRDRLAALADLDGKERVDVDMITPLLRSRERDGKGVDQLLAGDFVGAFGGFLDREIRRRDFALGWSCFEAYLEQGGLGRHVGDDVGGRVLDDVRAERPDDWRRHADHEDGIDQLDRQGRWQLVLLALQFGRVIAGESLPSPWSTVRERVGSLVGGDAGGTVDGDDPDPDRSD